MQRYIQGRTSKGIFSLLSKLKQRLRQANKRTLVKNLLLGLFALILLAVIVLGATFAWYAKDLPNPNALLDRSVEQSTKIYDRTGTHLLYEIALNEKRTLVPIDQISKQVQEATITAEDRNFYKHHGFSFTGYLRAAEIYILTLGRVKTGGSTITQQLVKQAILTNEKSVSRKIKELILSVAIEQIYTKDQILQMYLNENPYGGANYGIETAAETYYGKSANDVDLAEAATLAAIPQSPTTYINNPDLLKERRDWVLNGMVDQGYISREEADAALAEDTHITNKIGKIEAPHFVMWVKSTLEDKYTTREVETGGLKIVTTLDYDKQQIAETAVTNGMKNSAYYKFDDAGLVSIDPKTGQVLAMVGSPDYFDSEHDGQVNTTLQNLQPGSSIKPIVYAAAFEKGYTPDTLLWDANTTFPTDTGVNYVPHNYDGKEHGLVTMRKALQGSLNIPAVKTLYLVGIADAIKFAQRLGYTTINDPSKLGLSMVLGGVEVTPLEHTAAYATFANNGVRHDPIAILSVQDSGGNYLEQWSPDASMGSQVIDSNLSAIVSSVLSDNAARAYIFGAINRLTLGSRPVAVKTGTTNLDKDAWTVGYTPSLAAGVWVGNAGGTVMRAGADGSIVAAPIWNEYMKNALGTSPVENFPVPIIPQTGKAVLDGKVPGTVVTIDTVSQKLATDLTPDRYKKQVTCGQYHTILTYIDRTNPLGDAPSNPASDQMYSPWEKGVADYLTHHNADLKPGEIALENCEPPTTEDNVHTLQNAPTISILSPGNGSLLPRSFDISIMTSVKRTFSRVEYSIDGSYAATSTSPSGITLTLPGWVNQGQHTLAATIYDDVDNSAKTGINIVVSENGSVGAFRITNPFNAQTIEKTQPTYSVAVEIPNAPSLQTLSVIAINLWTGVQSTVGTTSAPNAITSFTWTLPDAGDYSLEAQATDKNGVVEESAPIKVYVRDVAPSGNITVTENTGTPAGEVAGANAAN